MACIVLQFEEVDAPFCDAAGFSPGLKVVLRFYGRRVTCFAGYELRDDYGGHLQELTGVMESDGTIRAFKELLHYVDDIRVLPDELDVRDIRKARDLVNRPGVLHGLGDWLEDQNDWDLLRKVLFQCENCLMRDGKGPMHLAVVHATSGEVLYDTSTTDAEYIRMQYLWTPLDVATPEELGRLVLSPLRYSVL